MPEPSQLDVVIVGAGFSGVQMLHRVRELGLRVRVLEAGSDVGGTWFWNRYPGARCDVESLEYSYQFSEELQQEWEWTERFATQPEILRYINHVVERFDLRRDIEFDTRVVSMTYDDVTARWTVRTEQGDQVVAQFAVMATGCLSSANVPNFPGLDEFAGATYHTGSWPQDGVDFAGKRVGVIGTGSSGVQVIPIIAGQAEELYVFQRTAAYTLPARNKPLDPALQAAIKSDYATFRSKNAAMQTAGLSRFPANLASVFTVSPAEREAAFEYRWAHGGPVLLGTYMDLMVDKDANWYAADFVRRKIREIVQDPEVAERLSPKQLIGCKRICLDTGYYETFNKPSVHLVDVAEYPIEQITPTGIRTATDEYELDAIVFATGFDAMTGALLRIDIRGRGGLTLQEEWSAGPRTYLGLGVPGFPNMFTMTGPGSPSVLTNMLVSIHQHVTWISDCLEYLLSHDIASIEATEDSASKWVEHVNEMANLTLYPSCNSWYLGANIPGKARVFMPLFGFPGYVQVCDRVAASDYEGFDLVPQHAPVSANV